MAYHQALASRKRRQRDRLVFSDAFLGAIAGELERSDSRLERRMDLLRDCLKQLPEHHRELVAWRYLHEKAVEQIAEELHKTPEAIYRMLSRIRAALHECVSRGLAREAHA